MAYKVSAVSYNGIAAADFEEGSQLDVASLRANTLSVKTLSPDQIGGASAYRVGVIYAENPAFTLSTLRSVGLTVSTRNPDKIGGATALRVGMIYAENPSFLMTTLREVSLVAYTRNPDIIGAVKGGRYGFLIAPNIGIASGARVAFLIEQVEVGAPVYVPQLTEMATQKKDVPPLSEVISYERVTLAALQVTIKYPDLDVPFPLSTMRSAQLIEMVVQAKPVSVQSYEKAAQIKSMAVSRFNYTIPGDLWSMQQTAQSYILVCQSLDIPYQPQSGVFARQNVVQVVMASEPLPIWTSPAYAGQLALQCVQKRPVEFLPNSISRAGQAFSQVTQPTEMPVPIGMEHTAQVVQLLVTPTVMPENVGMVMDGQSVMQVVTAYPDEKPISRTRVTQEFIKVLHARVEPLPISQVAVTQEVIKVLHQSAYPLPDEMVVLFAGQMVQQIVSATEYPPAYQPSPTMSPQVLVQFSTKPPASEYPSPEIVYEQSRKARVAQFPEMITQRLLMSLPISITRVPQMLISAVMRAEYDKPEDMANSGIFIRQAIEHVSVVAEYPTAGDPQSTVEVTQVVNQVAVEAEYPDAHLPVNYAITTQVVEQVSLVDAFPDPADMSSPVQVLQVTEGVGIAADYPDAGALHAPIVSYQVSEQVSLAAAYPDKDSPQSYAQVMQVLQLASIRATYPNKDLPQSTIRAYQVRQQVARRDLTMYQLPVPPRRHRVRIVFRYVY